jgi:hypothetical protein
LNTLLNYVIFVYIFNRFVKIFYRFVSIFNRFVDNVNGFLLNTFNTQSFRV